MSTLRASAAAFVPSSDRYTTPAATAGASRGQETVETVLPSAQVGQQQASLQERLAGPQQWQEDTYDDGYYDECGNWVYYDSEVADRHAAGAQGQPWQDTHHLQLLDDRRGAELSSYDKEASTDEDWQSLAVTADQAVGLLHTWYPTHSKPMLQQLYEACSHQLQDTINILAQTEAEQAASMQQKAAPQSAAANASKQASHQRQDWPDLAAAAQAEKGKTEPDPVNGRGSWATVARKAASVPAAAIAASSKPGSRQPEQAVHFSGSQSAVQPVPWVTTGAAVSQAYTDARAEASDYARIRNACFHQATIAYLAGNKALAKELSAKGKAAAQKMWEAHQQASQQIFTQRNAALNPAAMSAFQQVSRSTGVIDLHGLHVREVQTELPKQLAALAAQKQQGVNIIVGVGKHTKGAPGPRLLPAVEAVLQELGYKYRQPQPGLLRIDFR